jgi:hypothetical protein
MMKEINEIILPKYFDEIEVCLSTNAYEKKYTRDSSHSTFKKVFEKMFSDEKLKVKTDTVVKSVGTSTYNASKNALPTFVLGNHYQQGSYSFKSEGDDYQGGFDSCNVQYPFKSLSKYFAADIDGFNNLKDMQTVLEAFKTVPYVCCVFPSPSRLGFRVILKTNFECTNFDRYTDENDNDEKGRIVNEKFKPATEYILKSFGVDSGVPVKAQIFQICESANVDKNGQKNYIKSKGLYHIDVLKDVSRMWFFSSVLKTDKELIYINQNPTELVIDYSEIAKTTQYSANYKKYDKPFTGKSNSELDRFNKEFSIPDFLESQGFGKVRSGRSGTRYLNPNSTSKDSGEYMESGHFDMPVYCNYSSSCELAKYKDTMSVFTGYMLVKFLMFQGDKDKTFDYLKTLGYAVRKSFGITEVFSIAIDKKENEYVVYDPVSLVKFLTLKGFRKVLNDEDFELIKLKGLICKKVTLSYITDFIKQELHENFSSDIDEKKMVFGFYIQNFKKIFSEGLLDTLTSIEISVFKDTLKESFIMYQNGLVRITDETVEFSQDKDKFIWTENTIDRNFDLERFNKECNFIDLSKFDADGLAQFKELHEKCDFLDFCHRITDGQTKRFRQLTTSLGYLINTYRDPSNPRAVIYCDEKLDFSDNPNGGTGKGLLMKGIAKMRLTTSINGKTFDPNDQFCLALFERNSVVIAIDDTKKNLDFEDLFFMMTEGVVIRKLFKDPINLKGDNFPKIVLTTNYAIQGTSVSHNRRRFEVELFSYFDENRTPLDQYGKRFFGADWSEDDWFYFDSFMILTVKQFCKTGLVFAESINLDLKKFVNSTNIDFYEFIEGVAKANTGRYTNELFSTFKQDYPDFGNNLKFKVRTFNTWIDSYVAYKNKADGTRLNVSRKSEGKFLDIK